MAMTDEERESRIKALVREREGYVLHGKQDRVADVDAELKRLGAEGVVPAKRASKRMFKADESV